MRNTNPGFPAPGRDYNCANCAWATDHSLQGAETSALPNSKGENLGALEKSLGKRFAQTGSFENVKMEMNSLGEGARGIVFGSRGRGRIGHVFNTVKRNGKVYFIDGQTGGVANPNLGYLNFMLMVTSKGMKI